MPGAFENRFRSQPNGEPRPLGGETQGRSERVPPIPRSRRISPPSPSAEAATKTHAADPDRRLNRPCAPLQTLQRSVLSYVDR